ncbi:uncharacterized protein LOC141640740 [Silene latifolia]|uniref:uncharacterized protein LOC141640740 n=1 Tax=Silene latifolia TaxID=37657 RepID=UPI003D771BF4
MPSTELVPTTVDITDPLYCNPNDLGSTLKVTSVLTGVENYIPWKRGMELALSTKRKLGFVTGAVEKPTTDAAKIESWEAANSLVISLLVQNVSEPIKMAIIHTHSAKEIWKVLKGRYLVSNGARKYKLNKETYESKQNGKTVTEYYIQLRTVWDELENLNDYPILANITAQMSAFLTALEKQKEEARLFQFLNGLDKAYAQHRSVVLLMSPLPSVDDAVSIMVQEEAQQQNILVSPKAEVEASTLLGKGESTETETKCKHCGLSNHASEQCWFGPGNSRPKRGGYTSERGGYSSGRGQGGYRSNRGGFRGRGRGRNNLGYGNNSGYGNHYQAGSSNYQEGYKRLANSVHSEPSNAEIAASLAATSQHLEQLLKYMSGQKVGSKGGNDTDEELECNFAGIISCHNVKLFQREWIIDSGASDHMITRLHKLQNVKVLDKRPKINLPNGELAYVTHMGDLILGNGLRLCNVMYVPAFKHNLMYVQKLLRDNSCYVVFYDTHCTVQDSNTHEIKANGRAISGLYYLETPKTSTYAAVSKNNSSTSMFSNMLNKCNPKADKLCQEPLIHCGHICNDNVSSMNAKVDSYSLWHNRLGHAPYTKLQYINSIKLTAAAKNKQICLSCPMAKLTKTPYTLRNSTYAQPFDLVHIDIWGPYRVLYRGKYKYFLTLVDDYSRGTWVYLLEYKNQAYDYIKQFYEFAKTHFNQKIKIIRSDNAWEFDDKLCKEFFVSNGIVHQTSIVDRPQQNGIVERKHRHLLEIGRALRFMAGLPLQYWGDCIMTAAYLINRLPAPLIRNKTPYEMLHHKCPDYTNLKTFGCLVMAYNPERNKDKFQARGIPCVFIGYPANQKGYKVEELHTKKRFVTRDVKFYEHIFPFKQNQKSQFMYPCPVTMPSEEQERAAPVDPIHGYTHVPMEENHDRRGDETHGATTQEEQCAVIEAQRRFERQRRPPGWMKDFIIHSKGKAASETAAAASNVANAHVTPSFANLVAKLVNEEEPSTFYEAYKKSEWVDAMNTELDALEENQTWEITRLPSGRKEIGCK